MHRFLTVIALVATWFATSATEGAVISRDWKTPGDGLLTFDDVNQREWLDLTESRLSKFPGSTLEQRYLAVKSELEPGRLLEGFAVGKSVDLRQLAESAGIDIQSLDAQHNEVATLDLIELVGATVLNPSPGTAFASGLLDELTLTGRIKGHLIVVPTSGSDGEAGLILSAGIEPFQVPGVGVWLFRQVPEPGSGSLTMVALILGLSIVRGLARLG